MAAPRIWVEELTVSKREELQSSITVGKDPGMGARVGNYVGASTRGSKPDGFSFLFQVGNKIICW